jgi:hypothetical protein
VDPPGSLWQAVYRVVRYLLAAKRVSVDERSRQRIKACMDVATLEHWLDRALNATHVSEVLDEPAKSHS